MFSLIKFRLANVIGHEHVLVRMGRTWRRAIARTDEQIKQRYFATTVEPKLQIGGGWCRKEEWLNTDIQRLPDIMFMDATRPFPFDDCSFQYIFCEHMIEHITYEDAALMLGECWRVLRPSGAIRIVTPDLSTMIGLHSETLSTLQRAYLDFFYTAHLPGSQPSNATTVINGQMRMWGHKFLYDEGTLAQAMSDAGFKAIRRKRLGESDYSALRAVENEKRYPPGLLDFESLALEASRSDID